MRSTAITLENAVALEVECFLCSRGNTGPRCPPPCVTGSSGALMGHPAHPYALIHPHTSAEWSARALAPAVSSLTPGLCPVNARKPGWVASSAQHSPKPDLKPTSSSVPEAQRPEKSCCHPSSQLCVSARKDKWPLGFGDSR